jgi:CRISPR-associated protein Csb2
MLAITVELLHGVVRATSADDVTLTGDAVSPEWPPSPARLFAALVAGGGTGPRVPASVGAKGLSKLEGRVPDIYASAPSDLLTSAIHGRYVVIDERSENSVQNYVARSAQQIQPGARVSPRDPRIVYVWPDITLDADEVNALRYRAARVPYVGCADSPAVVRVHPEGVVVDSLPVWTPDPEGSVRLPVPPAGFLGDLDAHFARWTTGAPVRRSWLATPLCAYRTPEDRSPRARPPAATTLWVRFTRPIQQRRTVDVAELLRAAVLERVERMVGRRDAVPEVLHGHLAQRGPAHQSARWIPLPTVDVPHADGRLRGAAVWLPAGIDPSTIELVRDALADVRELIRPGVFATQVVPFDGTDRPWSSHPQRWCRESRIWRSVTPILYERYLKRPLQLADLADWCANAGLPAPIAFRSGSAPFVAGARQLSTDELVRNGRAPGQRNYLELVFDEAVAGPVVIGRGRGYGIGLFAPAGERAGR